MNINEKLEKVFSPLDVVTIEKMYEYIWPKEKEVDLPEGFFEDAKMYLEVGEHSSRNPTCWWIFEGREIDTSSELWREGVINFYRIVNKPEISELDNENYYIKMSAKFVLIAINAKELPPNAFEEIECATITTSFGDFPLSEAPEEK